MQICKSLQKHLHVRLDVGREKSDAQVPDDFTQISGHQLKNEVILVVVLIYVQELNHVGVVHRFTQDFNLTRFCQIADELLNCH